VSGGRASFALGPALLFCPADRPDRYAKALERADAVILDLEDAVAPDRRAAARADMLAHPVDPARTIVRVNGQGSGEFAADLALLRQTAYRYVMLPKADSTVDFSALAEYSVVALCETASGVLSAGAVAAAAPVAALMWGAEDLVASMGGTSSRGPDGHYRGVVAQARAAVAFAAAAHDLAMIDAVHLDINDHSGLLEEASDAAALGFVATACIHPSQVSVIRRGYRPSDTDIAWAHGVLEAVTAAGGGVVQHEGQMVDEPVLRHAEAILRRARVTT
jgi:citrate lyase subunit beta/citryl-CoA lyase